MALCREQGVVRASFHPDGSPNELLFGPMPPKPGSKAANGDPRKAKRDHYTIQLGRIPSDLELDHLP